MIKDSAQDILDQVDVMVSNRSHLEDLWTKTATHIAPYASSRGYAVKFETREQSSPFVETLSIQAAAALSSLVLEGTWHGLEFEDKRFNEMDGARAFLDGMRDALFAYRARAGAGFSEAVQEAVRRGLDFGVMPLHVYTENEQLYYHAPNPMNLYLQVDGKDRVTATALKYRLRARDAQDVFGSAVSEKLQTEAEDRTQNGTHEFVHYCGKEGEGYLNAHIEVDTQKFMWQRLTKAPALIAGRYLGGASGYGDSAGRAAIAPTMQLEMLNARFRRSAMLSSDPPFLSQGTDRTAAFAQKIQAGRILTDAVTLGGRAHIIPLQVGQLSTSSLSVREGLQEELRAIYLSDVLTQNGDIANTTATAIAALEQAKRIRLSSTLARMENEFLEPLIRAEIGALDRLNEERESRGLPSILPDLPQGVAAATKSAGVAPHFKVVFTGYMSREKQLREAAGLERAIATVAGLAQLNPGILARIDFDAAMESIANQPDVPSDLLKSIEEMQAEQRMIAGQQAQQVAAQQGGLPMDGEGG